MFSYGTIGSTDYPASLKFYDAALGALGYTRLHDYLDVGWVGYGESERKDDPTAQTLWVVKTPYNEQPATCGNGAMIGLAAKTRAQVDAFHAAALANGGTSEGAPGLRDAYGPNMYLAYVRDPMGNKFSAICRAPG